MQTSLCKCSINDFVLCILKVNFRFNLFYYSSFIPPKNAKDTILVVDTRGNKIQLVDDVEDFDEVEEDPLGSAIQTK